MIFVNQDLWKSRLGGSGGVSVRGRSGLGLTGHLFLMSLLSGPLHVVSVCASLGFPTTWQPQSCWTACTVAINMFHE